MLKLIIKIILLDTPNTWLTIQQLIRNPIALLTTSLSGLDIHLYSLRAMDTVFLKILEALVINDFIAYFITNSSSLISSAKSSATSIQTSFSLQVPVWKNSSWCLSCSAQALTCADTASERTSPSGWLLALTLTSPSNQWPVSMRSNPTSLGAEYVSVLSTSSLVTPSPGRNLSAPITSTKFGMDTLISW